MSAVSPEERAALDDLVETARRVRAAAEGVARAWERMVSSHEGDDGAEMLLAQLEAGRAATAMDQACAADQAARVRLAAEVAPILRRAVESHGLTMGRALAALNHGVRCLDPTCSETPEVEAVAALLRAGPH